jgi:queuine tRNA-ribosyltransferase
LDSVNAERGKRQILFGINQGGVYHDIRVEHAKRMTDLDMAGYALGGLAVGESHEEMYAVLEATVPHLPQEKPTYLMGVGTPLNILEAVERGIDFFDCVMPSRNGRHGSVFTNFGRLNLHNLQYERDSRPIDPDCPCPTCRNHSRAYLRHLLKAKETLASRLCIIHNLYFYNNMMEEIRNALDDGCFEVYKKRMISQMKGDA